MASYLSIFSLILVWYSSTFTAALPLQNAGIRQVAHRTETRKIPNAIADYDGKPNWPATDTRAFVQRDLPNELDVLQRHLPNESEDSRELPSSTEAPQLSMPNENYDAEYLPSDPEVTVGPVSNENDDAELLPENHEVIAERSVSNESRVLPNEADDSRVVPNEADDVVERLIGRFVKRVREISQSRQRLRAGTSISYDDIVDLLGEDTPRPDRERREDRDNTVLRICDAYVDEAIEHYMNLKSTLEASTYTGNVTRWCPYKLNVVFTKDTFPPVRFETECVNHSCNSPGCPQTGDNYCQVDFVNVPVLKKTKCKEGCCDYNREMVKMSVGCSCRRNDIPPEISSRSQLINSGN